MEIHCVPKGAQVSSIMAITTEPVKVREESNTEVHDWTHGSRRRPAHLLIGRQSFDFLSDQLYVHSQRNALFTTPTRAERKKLKWRDSGRFSFSTRRHLLRYRTVNISPLVRRWRAERAKIKPPLTFPSVRLLIIRQSVTSRRHRVGTMAASRCRPPMAFQ